MDGSKALTVYRTATDSENLCPKSAPLSGQDTAHTHGCCWPACALEYACPSICYLSSCSALQSSGCRSVHCTVDQIPVGQGHLGSLWTVVPFRRQTLAGKQGSGSGHLGFLQTMTERGSLVGGFFSAAGREAVRFTCCEGQGRQHGYFEAAHTQVVLT